MFNFIKRTSGRLSPRMNAYHEILLDKGNDGQSQLLLGGALQYYGQLCGPFDLLRKFKIAIAEPPCSDMYCFCHDVRVSAVADPETKRLLDCNLSASGGMGVNHSIMATYPRDGQCDRLHQA